jgi:type III pantothenate kinase
MLLALDVGNTNITLGIIREGAVSGARRAQTRPSATVDEMDLLLDGLLRLEGSTMAEVREIVLASVVPAITATIGELARIRGISLLVASAATVPLPVRVERPNEVGADRLVNALAAARLYGAPAIVVDFGTATNFDVVAADGAYVGGALAPGLELGIEALAARTAKLPRIELSRPARAIGRDTVSAMQSGAVIGYVGLVRELISAIRAELALDSSERAQVILTGGLSAAPWAADIPDVDAIDPNLTLRGLALLHAETAARTVR